MNLHIPDDIQIVGVNNEFSVCVSCNPPLSSIDIQPERIGYEGASILMDIIAGKSVGSVITIPPGELIRRGTTSEKTGYSPMVDTVLNFMHTNLGDQIEMEDILTVQSLGRRAFEKLFMTEIGQSPMTYLRSIRLQRIQFLLKATHLTVKEIGRQCGIPNITYLCRLFQKYHGVTPQEYRVQSQS